MNRSYKNTVIAVLLACILTMAIGYAVLNTRLSISGTSKITSDFNIQVTGISEFYTEQLAETANMSFTPTSATYSTNLQVPGDVAFYEIVIENLGNMAGYVYFGKDNWGYNDYNYTTSSDIDLGVWFVSKIRANVEDFFDWDSEIPQLTMLEPDEVLYVYAIVSLNENITSLPEQKNYSNTVNFDFYSAVSGIPNSSQRLNDALYLYNQTVSSGNGLYNVSGNEYVFKSDGTSTVNNYIKIDDKMWRIIGFYDSLQDTDWYYLVEDDDTINTPQVFSTVADANGYYNNFTESSLNDYLLSTIWNGEIDPGNYYYEDIAYVSDTEIFEYPYYGNHFFLSINEVLNTSSNTNCSINTLSSGSCRSWLTDNGNTYLINPVFESDKTTNTGKIAYLKDDKVISVDPQDTNYGEYKAFARFGAGCGYNVLYTNSDADGSKQKPYIINTEDMKNIGVC